MNPQRTTYPCVPTGITDVYKRQNLLCTRASAEHFEAVRAVAPQAEYHADARIVRVMRDRTMYGVGLSLIHI